MYMLNKANKLMEQRKAMINEAREVLVVLGAEDAVVPMSQVVINKGKVVKVEVPVVKEVQVTNEEEVERLYKENARHINRINELAADNEKLEDEIIKAESEIAFKDGQIIGYKRQIKELEDKIAELQAALDAKKLTKKTKSLQDELKDYKEELEKEEPKKVVNNIPKKKEKVEVISYENGYLDGIVRFKYLDKQKEYRFTASNKFNDLIIYDWRASEREYEIAKETIIKHQGNVFAGYTPADESEVLYAEDKESKIKAFCKQGVFYGYCGDYFFMWDHQHDIPAGCGIKVMDHPNRVIRKMNASWGNGFVKRAEDIMAVCKTMNYIDYKREQVEAERGYASSVPSSNEVVVDVNDNVDVDMSDEDILNDLDI